MPKQLHILINGRRCITIDEASAVYHYSPAYMRAFARKQRIPYHLIGNTGLVDADALHERLETHIHKPKTRRAKTSASATKNRV